MRIRRLNSAELARLLGDGTGAPKGPSDLAGVVIPTLDITPFLLGTPEGGAISGSFSYTGAGRIRSIAVANPAAGADYNIALTTEVWELLAFQATFTASATVATRRPRLSARDDGDNSLFLVPDVSGITASQAFNWVWARGINSRASAGGLLEVSTDLPFVVLGPSWRLRTLTANIQVGDQWSGGRLFVKEYD